MNVVSPNPSETYLHRMNSGSKHQFTSKIYQALRRWQSLRPGYQLWRSPHLLRLDAARPRLPKASRTKRRSKDDGTVVIRERSAFWILRETSFVGDRKKVIYRVAAALFASSLVRCAGGRPR